MNEDNITQDAMLKIADQQNHLYDEVLEKFMVDKNIFLNRSKQFETELFTLEKIIKRNKRLGNDNAVIRDEVQVKSYQLLRAQSKMIRRILRALDHYDFEEFEQVASELFSKNQLRVQELTTVDYHPILKQGGTSDTLMQAQRNIKDFYALQEINADILTRVADLEKKIYRLNHYSNYGLIKPALAIDNSSFARTVNPILMPYGLDVVKVLLILLLSLVIYFIRKVLFSIIEKLLLKVTYLKKYSQEILDQIRKPIDIILILINLEIAIYIYNDFNSLEEASRFFNMAYAFLFTLIVYKTLNTVASIKVHDMDQSDKKIKNEMVNVAIKIINFLIIILGLLLILHFAGANLTAVLSGLGIGGFAVAIAARESLSNFLGTISILLSDVFSQGDWIVVDGKQGTVVEIGLRVTTLRTFDNALIAIPNGNLANQDVLNWSKRTIGRRIKMNLSIKYDSKAKDIQNAVEQIREMLKNHPGLATESTDFQRISHKSTRLVSQEDDQGVKKTMLVYLDELSDSSINILVYCFTKTTNWNEWLRVKEDVIYKIMAILEVNSLEFALPSLSLYVEKESTPSLK